MQTPPSRVKAPIEVRDSDTDSDNDNMTDVKQSKPQRPSKAAGRAKAVAAAIAAAAPEPNSVPLPTSPAPAGGGGGGGGGGEPAKDDPPILSQDPDPYAMAAAEEDGKRHALTRLQSMEKWRRMLVEEYIVLALGPVEGKEITTHGDTRLNSLINFASDYYVAKWVMSDLEAASFPAPREHYALYGKLQVGMKRPRSELPAFKADAQKLRSYTLTNLCDDAFARKGKGNQPASASASASASAAAAAAPAAPTVAADSKDAAMVDATESDSDSDEESDEPDTEEDAAATNAEMLIAEVIVDLKDGKLPGKDDRDITDLYKMLGKHVEDHDDISGGGVSDRRAMGYLDRFVKYRRTLSGDLTLPIAQQLFDYCATVLDLELVVPGMKVSANPDAEPVASARKSKRRKIEKSAPLPEHTEL